MIGAHTFQDGTYQDWKTVVLKPKKEVQTKVVEKSLLSNKNSCQHITNESINIKKLDAETEEFHHKKVPSNVGKDIVTARCARKLTQQALANSLNMNVKDIAEIESGRAIYNGQQLSKIKRFLGLH